MDLFLNEDVPGPIRTLIAKRIREVEASITAPAIVVPRGTPSQPVITAPPAPIGIAQQSPSMQRIMQSHPEVPVTLATPVTPAASEALQKRADIINGRLKEKPEAGRTGPRKF